MPFVGKIRAAGGLSSVGSTLYGLCSSNANDEIKVVSIDGLDTLFVGLSINVKFTNSNRVSTPKLRISGSGIEDMPIYLYGATRPGTTDETSWKPGSVLELTYDGTGWQVAGWINDNTKYDDATRDTHGLLTAAGKRKLDDLNADSVLVFGNPDGITVSSEAWSQEQTPTYSGYGFKAVLTCTGVTVDHVPSVTFRPADLDAYSFAPVAVSGENTVTIYCGIKPAVDIVIPSIVAVKKSSV